jgi:hypothetical protein
MKVEAAGFSEMLRPNYQTSRRHIPEDSNCMLVEEVGKDEGKGRRMV